MSVLSFSREILEFKGQQIKVLGNIANLQQGLLGVLCSRKCPGELILKAYDAVKNIREEKRVVVSGFHSPIEKDLFEILLRGSQPIILCLAKNLDGYRVPKVLQKYINRGQLTIIAPRFNETEDRFTQQTSKKCNQLIIQLCDRILMIHVQPKGNLAEIISQSNIESSRFFTIKSPHNEHLLEIGVGVWDNL